MKWYLRVAACFNPILRAGARLAWRIGGKGGREPSKWCIFWAGVGFWLDRAQVLPCKDCGSERALWKPNALCTACEDELQAVLLRAEAAEDEMQATRARQEMEEDLLRRQRGFLLDGAAEGNIRYRCPVVGRVVQRKETETTCPMCGTECY